MNALPVKIRSALVCVAKTASAGSRRVVTAAITWAAMGTTLFAARVFFKLAASFQLTSHVILSTAASME